MSQGFRDMMQGIVVGVVLVAWFGFAAWITDAGELSDDRGIERECGE